MTQIDSELLRTFLAVAETGSFTQAATAIGRTQSAVSLQVKKLEDLLPAVLFRRLPRGVELTAAGGRLRIIARRIVAMLDEAAASFDTMPLDGPVRIGLPEEYASVVLGRALRAFAASHSGVDVTVRYGRSSENLSRIKRGELDLAVGFDWQDVPQGEVLATDPTVWCTSDSYSQHERSPLPIALYTSSGWCKDFALRSLDERDIRHRTVFTSDTSGGLKLAVSSGLAIAPLSRTNIPAGCRELTAADGFGQIDASTVVLHRNLASTSEAIKSMAEAIRTAFQTSASVAEPSIGNR